MNLLLGFAAFAVVLLALDLLTAPKHRDNVGRAPLKGSRRAA